MPKRLAEDRRSTIWTIPPRRRFRPGDEVAASPKVKSGLDHSSRVSHGKHSYLVTPTSITELIDNADADHCRAVRFLKWRRDHPYAKCFCHAARKDRVIATPGFLIGMPNAEIAVFHRTETSEAQQGFARKHRLLSGFREV